MIRAGTIQEANSRSGQWAFVDVGFAAKAKSSCLLVGEGRPRLHTFSEIGAELSSLAAHSSDPLNLVLEAPLSVAFTQAGNPTGRTVEKRGNKTRYWYVGLGSSVLLAAAYLLRRLHDGPRRREIRLFEGFVSFKETDGRSSHSDDVNPTSTCHLESRIWDCGNLL
jgi:hypothetical protein